MIAMKNTENVDFEYQLQNFYSHLSDPVTMVPNYLIIFLAPLMELYNTLRMNYETTSYRTKSAIARTGTGQI